MFFLHSFLNLWFPDFLIEQSIFALLMCIGFSIIIHFLLKSGACLVMLSTILAMPFLVEAEYSSLKTILSCPRNKQLERSRLKQHLLL